MQMTDSDDKLSYLLDDYREGDASADLDDIIGDVNLQYRARRYRMIGEVMRHELPRTIDSEFHTSVMSRIAALEDDRRPAAADGAAARQQSSPWAWSWLKPVAGLAVAASVAVVTVALWQQPQRDAGQPGEAVVSAEQQKIQALAGQALQGGVVPASTRLRPLGTRWKVERDMPGLQQKLNGYLVNHTEYSNSVQGLIPQARVAGFDAQR
jgi:sigma-E factor negative regulatory protein RseA